MDSLDQKLNEVYPGRVVRKDLLHQIKKGTNVPSFVLEFLLAKYCASDDPDEIDAGITAVFETIQKNYVRPDEANKAQSMVQQKGRHKYIDKIHVKYVEREKRHWAEMENFNSRRIAIPDKFYRDNERLLAGGIWAEVTVAHNDVDEDDYAFYIEEMRPIQLSRFNGEEFLAGREKFSRDEWMDVLLRSIGMEPSKLSLRLKFHFLARRFGFVETNFNFIELGPRGTGKSYVFSEFSPYSTLVSGGQASTPILFYNNARRQVGLVGYWDMVAFDEVGGIRIKDQSSVDILKDYMANGRFSRGFEVVADASLAFVGNIDHSIEQLVNSTQFDLFISLPESFDLAVMDRFHLYLPGWEMPKNSSEYLTSGFGFITDYLAEAFHRLSRTTSRYEYVNRNCSFGKSVEGRDEKAVKKTVSALLKLLHPIGEPTREELVQYMEYALEGRRRVKEQMNKRKPDDEFAKINLTYFDEHEKEIVVWCLESKGAEATQRPTRKTLPGLAVRPGKEAKTKPIPPEHAAVAVIVPDPTPSVDKMVTAPPETPVLKEKHIKIFYDDVGHTYESLFGEYLRGAKIIDIEDAYIRAQHQIANFVRFCELVVKVGSAHTINLTTTSEDADQQKETEEKLQMLAASLIDRGIKLTVTFDDHLHDREIRLDNGWKIKIGRGLEIYQKPDNWFTIGANDFEQRPCLETGVDIFKYDAPAT